MGNTLFSFDKEKSSLLTKSVEYTSFSPNCKRKCRAQKQKLAQFRRTQAEGKAEKPILDPPVG